MIPQIWACFTVLVGKEASATQTNIIARNSDSKDARRGKVLKIYTTTEGRKLYIGLPYWDLIFDPGYDMAQVATNQYGVSISATQTIQSNRIALTLDPPAYSGNGVSEPNIPAIVMPTAVSAIDAIKILGQAIETRGVNDGWGFGVAISDDKEIWYLETLSGHQWVAIKIPNQFYFVAANGPGQIQEYEPAKYTYLFSHYQDIDPKTFALQFGFAHYKNGIFNFRASYGDVQAAINHHNNFIRIAYAQHYLSPSIRPFHSAMFDEEQYPMFLKPDHPITFTDIATLQSSHYEDYPEFDPYQWSYQIDTLHPFYYPIANPRTSNAHITEIRAPYQQDVGIANIQYIALGMPTLSVYLPIYYGLNKIPTRLQGVTNKADHHSLFWQFRKIQSLVFLHDPEKNIPYAFPSRKAYVQKLYQAFTQQMREKQKNLEKAYRQSHDSTLIDQFTQTLIDELAILNDQIIQYYFDLYELDQKYHLSNTKDRNTWFTQLVRQQDCFYRRYHCDPTDSLTMHGWSYRDKYVDE